MRTGIAALACAALAACSSAGDQAPARPEPTASSLRPMGEAEACNYPRIEADAEAIAAGETDLAPAFVIAVAQIQADVIASLERRGPFTDGDRCLQVLERAQLQVAGVVDDPTIAERAAEAGAALDRYYPD